MVNKCRLLGEINHLQQDAPDNTGQRGRERSLYELPLLYSTVHTYILYMKGVIFINTNP